MRVILGLTIIIVGVYFIEFHQFEKPECTTPEDFLDRSVELMVEQKLAENMSQNKLTTSEVKELIQSDYRINKINSDQVNEADFTSACYALDEILVRVK